MSLSVRLSETIFPNFEKIAFTAPIMWFHIEIVIFIVGRLGKIYLLLSLIDSSYRLLYSSIHSNWAKSFLNKLKPKFNWVLK